MPSLGTADLALAVALARRFLPFPLCVAAAVVAVASSEAPTTLRLYWPPATT